MAPRVEFLWWSECPSWERALADLRAAMVEHELDPGSIEVREITSEADAEAEGVPGFADDQGRLDAMSPTPSRGCPGGLVCRMYVRRDRRISPLPDPLDVREAPRG